MNKTHRALARRSFLSSSALMSVALLGACAITSNGGTTTGTLDVTRITTDGQAIVAALEALVVAPAIVVLLGPKVAVASAAFAAASAALTEIQTITGGTVTASIDTAKVKALVASLLDDAKTVVGLVQGVLPNLSGPLAEQVGNYVAAVQTLLPFVALAAQVSLVGATSATARPMTEADALATIRVERAGPHAMVIRPLDNSEMASWRDAWKAGVVRHPSLLTSI